MGALHIHIISNSDFDEPFKQVLLKAVDATMKEVLADVHAGSDAAHLEQLVSQAIVDLAKTGQTSPGQLQRYAVSQVKSYLLTQSADRMFGERSRSSIPEPRARRISLAGRNKES